MFPLSAPAPKAAKSAPAIFASAPKRSIDEHRHRGEERLPGRVPGDEQRDPDAQQRLVDEEAQAREDALATPRSAAPAWPAARRA